MKISNIGINLISEHEGCKLKAYRCQAGVLTIGVGHTGSDVVEGMTITQAQANELLRRDLSRFESGVDGAVRVPLTQNMFDALVSLSFNIGLGAFQKSTLLAKLNASDYMGAADQFLVWNRAGGSISKGLQRRRVAERKLFQTGMGALKYNDTQTNSQLLS